MAENSDKGEKTCPNCGKKNKEGRVYCNICGEILNSKKKADC